MKKRMLAVMAALLALIVVMGGCGAPNGSSGKITLNILNWGDYISDDLIDEFEAKYGIDINYIPASSNEEMYVSITTEGSYYDIIFPSDYLVERLVSEGYLREIDYDKLPGAQYLDDKFMNRGGVDYDSGNVYSVPYTWGTLGILYNTKYVTEPVTSWNILWDEDYSGEIYMYDSMRDSISAALLRLGYDLNTRSEAEIADAVEALKAQKPLVKSYGGDEMRDSMIGGSGALCLTYSGDAVYCMMENPDLAFAVPEEGSNIFFDCMVIPVTCKNEDAAYQFINFLLDPEVATINTEYIGYSTPNAKVMELIGEDYLSNNAFNPSDDVIGRCTVFHDLGDFTQVYSDAWQEVKWYTP
jgi:Spermidine/putrescine-binding periplasmic protein